MDEFLKGASELKRRVLLLIFIFTPLLVHTPTSYGFRAQLGFWRGPATPPVPIAPCGDLPPSVTTQPIVDLRASEYSGSGDWINSGSAGSAYNMMLGNGSSAGTYPTFVATAPAHFSYDGGDYFTIRGANTTFINSIHQDNAVFTIVYEGYVTGGDSIDLANTGTSWNAAGFAFQTYFDNDEPLTFEVGAQTPSTNQCSGGFALCAELTNNNLSAPSKLFGAIAVNEGTGEGRFRMNNRSSTFTSTYNNPTTSVSSSKLKIGGPDTQASGSKIYRFRMWNVALSDAQLLELYQHSTVNCGW